MSAERALNVAPRVSLISHVMQHSTYHSIRDRPIGRVGPFCSKTAETFSKAQRSPVFVAAHSIRPQPPKGSQLIFGILKTVCDRKSARPGRAGLTHGPFV